MLAASMSRYRHMILGVYSSDSVWTYSSNLVIEFHFPLRCLTRNQCKSDGFAMQQTRSDKIAINDFGQVSSRNSNSIVDWHFGKEKTRPGTCFVKNYLTKSSLLLPSTEVFKIILNKLSEESSICAKKFHSALNLLEPSSTLSLPWTMNHPGITISDYLILSTLAGRLFHHKDTVRIDVGRVNGSFKELHKYQRKSICRRYENVCFRWC